MEAIELIRERVRCCEVEAVEVLCCPEAILGGLADYAPSPADIAIDVEAGQLDAMLAPLVSDTVTTILGFTERSRTGQFCNAAAVFHKGTVVGLYRKRYPAIRESVYQAGNQTPVFSVGDVTFGIMICNDSNHPELARAMASQGATMLFVPTNNALPLAKADVVDDARRVDIVRATENRVTVIRADVAGRTTNLLSYGSSCIVASDGTVLMSAQRLAEDLLIADVAQVHRLGG